VVNPSMHRTDMVHGITETLAHEFKQLPQHQQDEYGQHYLQVHTTEDPQDMYTLKSF
jgi:hypothetical protein